MLDEFNVKMAVSKSGTTCKILQYLAEPSKVLQKCCSSFRLLWNWANTVNLCAALKTESLFSLVNFSFSFAFDVWQKNWVNLLLHVHQKYVSHFYVWFVAIGFCRKISCSINNGVGIAHWENTGLVTQRLEVSTQVK